MVDIVDRQIATRELQMDVEYFQVERTVEDGVRDAGPDERSEATVSVGRSVLVRCCSSPSRTSAGRVETASGCR